MKIVSHVNYVGSLFYHSIMREFVMTVRDLTKEELYNRRKQDQINARKTEAKVKWMKTKIKVCIVCDNKFPTQEFEELACSFECYRELRRCQK